MPDPTQAQPSPAAAGAGGPQSAPMGSSPATGPTANRGYEVAAKQGMGVIMQGLERLLPMVGAASDVGKDILSMLKMASRHVQPGEVTPAAAKNEMDKAQFGNAQNMQMIQRLKAQQAQQGQPGQQQQMPQQKAA